MSSNLTACPVPQLDVCHLEPPAPEPRPCLCAGILAVCLGVLIGAQHLGEEIHHSLGWPLLNQESAVMNGLSARARLVLSLWENAQSVGPWWAEAGAAAPKLLENRAA